MSSSAESKAGDWLRRASSAPSSGARAKYATRGLEQAGNDPTLRAMLLRQLYLAQLESEHFEAALETARAAHQLGVLPDVACQDLARAHLALGQHRQAIDELRRASRVGPAARRAFHLWTMGSLLYFREDYAGAARAFERAVRWGTTARPLYRAQLLLARLALSRKTSTRTASALMEARRELESAACAEGYGRYVLGELAHRQGDAAAARLYLEEFMDRADTHRVALRVGLSAELGRARQLLALYREGLDAEESAKL